MNPRSMLLVLVILLFAACVSSAAAEEFPSWEPPSVDEVEATLAGLPFNEFADEVSRVVVLYGPLGIPKLGLGELMGVRNDRLGISGIAATETYVALSQVILSALVAYDRDSLPFNQRVSYDALYEVFSTELSTRGDSSLFWQSIGPASNNSLIVLERILEDDLPSDSIEDLDDYIVLLWQMDDMVRGWIEEIERSQDVGIFLPRAEYISIKNTLRHRTAHYGIEAHPYHRLGREKLSAVAGVDETYQQQFLERLMEVIEQNVAPAFEDLLDAINRIASLASREMNWAQHPAWLAYYRGKLREVLGTDMTPEAIFAMANAEIDRITTELASLRAHTDGSASLPVGDIIGELWGPQHHCSYAYTAGAMLEDAQFIYESTLISAAELFDQLPETALKIELDVIDNPTYEPAPFDGSGQPTLYIPSETMFEKHKLPSLLFHEALPGHHLQFAIARAADIPLLFQFNMWSGFTEGWATYAEQLAAERGWHSRNVCAYVSFLSDQLLTAYLTAIETGLLGFGWDMDHAVNFIQPYMQATRYQLEPFFTRLFYMPTQFTRYFVGRMVLLNQRERAMVRLGDDFDLAGFHQAVLEHGAVPLGLLAAIVDEYVQQEMRGLLVP